MTEDIINVTKEDLAEFRENLLKELDSRFNAFIDDFLDAMSESQPECDCPECSETEEKLNNPRRYMIQAGGNTWGGDNFKPKPMSAGIDCIWTEELGGKIKTVRGTISSPDVSIFDFENDMTPEIFDSIKRQTIDFAIQTAQEAQARDKAIKASTNQETVVDSSSHISYG